MNKKITVLNGAARKTGNTAKLVEAFSDGAKSAGNQVTVFYLDGMDIHSCKGCLHASFSAPRFPALVSVQFWLNNFLFIRCIYNKRKSCYNKHSLGVERQ